MTKEQKIREAQDQLSEVEEQIEFKMSGHLGDWRDTFLNRRAGELRDRVEFLKTTDDEPQRGDKVRIVGGKTAEVVIGTQFDGMLLLKIDGERIDDWYHYSLVEKIESAAVDQAPVNDGRDFVIALVVTVAFIVLFLYAVVAIFSSPKVNVIKAESRFEYVKPMLADTVLEPINDSVAMTPDDNFKEEAAKEGR